MSKLQFLKVKDANLLDLVALGRQTFLDAYASKNDPKEMQDYLEKAFSTKKLTKELSNPAVQYFFIYKKEELLGYIKIRWDRTTEKLDSQKALEIERFYLLKAYYGQGFGQLMLDFCENQAKNYDFQWIWLLVWPKNTQGLSFYTKNGFQKFATKGFEFGGKIHEDWLLRKKI